MLRAFERRLPDWLWAPTDKWSRYKGYGRFAIFAGVLAVFAGVRPAAMLAFTVGVVLYGIGLLGLRMRIEKRRKGGGA